MLILQDTINDERSRRSSAAEGPASAPGPAPTPTASQNNHESPGQFAGCSQPSIVPNPSSSSSVRRTSAVCDISIDGKKIRPGEYLVEVLVEGRGGGMQTAIIPSQKNSDSQRRVRDFSFLRPISSCFINFFSAGFHRRDLNFFV